MDKHNAFDALFCCWTMCPEAVQNGLALVITLIGLAQQQLVLQMQSFQQSHYLQTYSESVGCQTVTSVWKL